MIVCCVERAQQPVWALLCDGVFVCVYSMSRGKIPSTAVPLLFTSIYYAIEEENTPFVLLTVSICFRLVCSTKNAVVVTLSQSPLSNFVRSITTFWSFSFHAAGLSLSTRRMMCSLKRRRARSSICILCTKFRRRYDICVDML